MSPLDGGSENSENPRGGRQERIASPEIEDKKADVAEHSRAFNHVGLLFNEPPAAGGLPFT
jgi:hypothetical protein